MMPSLVGVCFWRAAPGAAVGSDWRAGKRGLPVAGKPVSPATLSVTDAQEYYRVRE